MVLFTFTFAPKFFQNGGTPTPKFHIFGNLPWRSINPENMTLLAWTAKKLQRSADFYTCFYTADSQPTPNTPKTQQLKKPLYIGNALEFVYKIWHTYVAAYEESPSLNRTFWVIP